MRVSVIVWLACMALSGCSMSPGSRYYTLTPSPAPAVQPASAAIANITLSAFTIPALLDRPQMILRSGANNVSILEYERWAEPLDSMAVRIFQDDLMLRAGKAAVDITGARRISVAIDEFDANASGQVMLAASWTVETDAVKTRYDFRQSDIVNTHDISAVVASMSGLLGKLADAIVAQNP